MTKKKAKEIEKEVKSMSLKELYEYVFNFDEYLIELRKEGSSMQEEDFYKEDLIRNRYKIEKKLTE